MQPKSRALCSQGEVTKMSYPAHVFTVMIASPGDVAAERAIVREVLSEWNAIHAQSRKIVLLPAGWESHSSPDMGKPAQSIINEQVLDKCDLLVGVFWTRIGSQTTEYASGTVEEIERHIASGKPAMLYFSEQPARLDSVDSKQYEELMKFKSSCMSRGLYQTYDDMSQFKERFYHQLQLKLNQHDIFTSLSSAASNDNFGSPKILQLPKLSDEAKRLLKEATSDRHGTIIMLRHMGGTDLQTNGKNLIDVQDRKVVAKWESALEQLRLENLVVERGTKGEVFEVTDQGFKIAEHIPQ